jgi:protein-L-isoaspartate(D-aspartate) O-methyltransferase
MYDKKLRDMIDRLRGMGITDDQTLAAMSRVARHNFVAKGLEHQAYDEKSLPIGYGQTISHPYTVALMTQSLQLKKGDRVLEIGAGSGYQTAVLCEMGAQVFSVERVAALGQLAKERLKIYDRQVFLRVGDGSLGWQNYAPYDAIIVTAGAPVTPDSLIRQLKNEGRMIIPVGSEDEQALILYLKFGNELKKMELERMKFVPLCGLNGWKKQI